MYGEEIDDYDVDMEYNPSLFFDPLNKSGKYSRKNQEAVNKFLGGQSHSVETLTTERYYGGLLAWTVKCITTLSGWKTISLRGYSLERPIYRAIQTDYTKKESCMINGQMLMEKDGTRLVITVMISAQVASIQIEAKREHQELVNQIIGDFEAFLKDHNFYKGKKLCFVSEISFLNVGQRDWSSVILDNAMKEQIRLNTIGFLKNCKKLSDYDWPFKRGIILSGEPGTGKTAICKALISEADNITCITSDANGMLNPGYISDLFAITQDLNPSIVFIEDVDFVAQERQDFFHGIPPLISLLAEMDGIEDKTAIVTVATTNSVETLDKALSERPSRFDRVFKISRPDYQRRIELLKYLSNKIPLSEDIVDYIAQKTNGFTPAQVQEVPKGMVITQLVKTGEVKEFSQQDVDAIISQMNYKNAGRLVLIQYLTVM